MPASVLDVAAHILREHGAMTHMKLQRLCYFAQAWHLVWTAQPLFPERIEAWANGPVVPVLYQALRGDFTVDADTLQARLSDPVARERVCAQLLEEGLLVREGEGAEQAVASSSGGDGKFGSA